MWKFICERGRTAWIHISEEGEQRLGYPRRKAAFPKPPDTSLQPQDFPFDAKVNPNSGDKFFRALQRGKLSSTTKESFKSERCINDAVLHQEALKACRRGIEMYSTLQQADGCWSGDYGGPMFLLPGLVFVCYATKTPIPEPHRFQMIRYVCNHQLDDGGWPLHIEMRRSSSFGTALNYVALRLLGVSADDAAAKRGRDCLTRLGIAGVPPWGKFWLAVLGLYSWDGVDSLMPEIWALPHFIPLHPWRFWCHCRMVYLPMSFVYGRRFIAVTTPLLDDIRQELYPCGYDHVDWIAMRGQIVEGDAFSPPNKVYKLLMSVFNVYERYHSTWLRKRAMRFMYDYICAEDLHTDFIDIGPVNKCINLLCRYIMEGPSSEAFQSHVRRLGDYLWIAEDGMKMQGYNGSPLWDTSLAALAITEARMAKEFIQCSIGIYRFLEMTQIRQEVQDREKYYRHISKGSWPFSTRDHGWPVADTTAFGLQAVLELKDQGIDKCANVVIDDFRIYEAVNVLLSLQGRDGGWATYELQRSNGTLLEMLNPSAVFADIMVDYSYVELTSSVLQALATFRRQYPVHRAGELILAMQHGVDFILSRQRSDGSFYGSWAVCFTYGTWLALDALWKCGHDMTCQQVRKACAFLLAKQRPDGSWGESYLSNAHYEYIQHREGQVVNTSWALLALMAADSPIDEVKGAIQKGVRFLIAKQEADGDWSQQGCSGIFNANCVITYTSYRNVFPIRALGRFARSLPECC